MTINDYIKVYQEQPDIVLLDVRTEAEFDEGHIPGSINIPLDELPYMLDAPAGSTVYVYCRSGRRSGNACYILQEEGFDPVNIGGILDYTGPKE